MSLSQTLLQRVVRGVCVVAVSLSAASLVNAQTIPVEDGGGEEGFACFVCAEEVWVDGAYYHQDVHAPISGDYQGAYHPNWAVGSCASWELDGHISYRFSVPEEVPLVESALANGDTDQLDRLVDEFLSLYYSPDRTALQLRDAAGLVRFHWSISTDVVSIKQMFLHHSELTLFYGQVSFGEEIPEGVAAIVGAIVREEPLHSHAARPEEG